MEGILLKLKHLLVVAACGIAALSSFVVSASYDSKSVGNSDATVTGSARMTSYDNSKDLCVMTAALGGTYKEAASGSVSGRITGGGQSQINLSKAVLNKNCYSYSTSKKVKKAYTTFKVTITLDGVGTKDITVSY